MEAIIGPFFILFAGILILSGISALFGGNGGNPAEARRRRAQIEEDRANRGGCILALIAVAAIAVAAANYTAGLP